MANLNSFDFMVTEESGVILLMYARDSAPDDPAVQLFPEQHKINIYRTDDEALSLEDVEDNIFTNLQGQTTLLVCELSPTENEGENEIVYTYEADIVPVDNKDAL
jgi:hypothetical protein